jgi:acyl dehydratase
VVSFRHTGRNQHGEVVATVLRATLMRTNPDAA